ncbi:malectin domain-containing carbohydrate-binding protein [Flexithrix dorotheae]|uniref:malectin domain-containing carbohydrate-binding protein n=1 Tax=Flexithrix dorotheae TaxID=70993 RepID=UPI000377B105|nr:malectin domain-containing carbohydrate-binding protein [Flexithrix dorotheae]
MRFFVDFFGWTYFKFQIVFIFLTFSNNLFGQNGLTYSQEEIKIWRERAGLDPGQTLYNSPGDAGINTPGEWEKIIASANRCVQNSANDRYTNYWKEASCVPNLHTYSDRTIIDNMEPRPQTKGNHGANSVMDAGFVYLLTKDRKYSDPVRTELMWYATNKQLDFSNRNIWCTGQKSFNDLNPGFFIAEWCTKMLLAYDYTKDSPSFSQGDKDTIEKWLLNAAIFFDEVYRANLNSAFPGRENNDYTKINAYQDRKSGDQLWDGGPEAWNLSLVYNNRRSAHFRFSFLAGIFLNDLTLIDHGKRAFKEWVAFGTFGDGSHSDLYRGKSSWPEIGWTYTSACVDHAISMADAYARKFDNSLYDYTIGDEDIKLFFPDANKSKGWYKDLAVKGKGLKKAIDAFVFFIDGTYGDSRRRGDENIDGFTTKNGGRNFVEDVWVSTANVYYKDLNVQAIYTRAKEKTRKYPSNPTNTGSFQPWSGVAATIPSKLFMYGQMEGKVWPFKEGKFSQEITFDPIPTQLANGGTVKLNAVSSSGLPVTFSIVSGPGTLSGNTFTITEPGKVVIKANQDGDKNFAPTYIEQTFYVKKKITVKPVKNQFIKTNGSLENLEVEVEYLGSNSGSLTLQVTSKDQSVISDEKILISGNGVKQTLKITPETDQTGNITLTIVASDGTDTSDPVNFNVFVGDAETSYLRLDAGLKSDSVEYDNKLFVPLLPYLSSGEALDSDNFISIANTTFDELYQTETWCRRQETKFLFPVLNGAYTVHLHFVDWHYENEGDRVFDLYLEGEKKLDDFDIIKEVGRNAALVKSFDVLVLDENMELMIDKGNGYPQISGIEIVPQGTQALSVESPDAKNQVITFASIGTRSLEEGTVKLNVKSSAGLPVTLTVVSGPATLNGNTLTLNGLGEVTIKASAPGNENYLPADEVIQTFSITNKVALKPIGDQILAQNAQFGPEELDLDYGDNFSKLSFDIFSENQAVIKEEDIKIELVDGKYMLTIVPEQGAKGVSNITITVKEPNGGSSTISFNVLVENLNVPTSSYRFDAGLISGQSEFEGKVFDPLMPMLKSGTGYNSYAYWVEDIDNTQFDELYKSEIWCEQDTTILFKFPVENGKYTMHLHFADLYSSDEGTKMANVKIQNKLILQNFDVVKEAGVGKAMVKSFNVSVTGEEISLEIKSLLGYNQISAVEILPQGEEALRLSNVNNNNPVFADFETSYQLKEGEKVEILMEASDPDGDPISFKMEDMPTFGTLSDFKNGSAKLVLSPGYNSSGTYEFNVLANDDQGGSTRMALSLEVEDLPLEMAVKSLTLINTETGEDIKEVAEGDTINIKEIGTRKISLRADVTSESVSEVSFVFDNENFLTKSAPFLLSEAENDEQSLWEPNPGTYALSATPYSLKVTPEGIISKVGGISHNLNFTIVEEDIEFNLVVYPNPFEDQLFVDFDKAYKGEIKVLIYDTSGRTQYASTTNFDDAQGGIDLYLPEEILNPGMYILKIFSEDQTLNLVKRIVKH